jgi:hypothetical protein
MNFQPDHDVRRVMQEFARKVGLKDFTMNIYNDRSEVEGIQHSRLASIPI